MNKTKPKSIVKSLHATDSPFDDLLIYYFCIFFTLSFNHSVFEEKSFTFRFCSDLFVFQMIKILIKEAVTVEVRNLILFWVSCSRVCCRCSVSFLRCVIYVRTYCLKFSPFFMIFFQASIFFNKFE